MLRRARCARMRRNRLAGGRPGVAHAAKASAARPGSRPCGVPQRRPAGARMRHDPVLPAAREFSSH
ncbi:hypothetical protein BURMUCF2_3126 [Burkholderia multivorans CF2]|nr:hypothetical protein BURMUCF2_3126 [Burkholderia multivorans CF2]